MRMVFALILTLSIIMFANCYSYCAEDEDGPEVGEDAPDFTLKGFDGKEVALSDLEGIKPVILFFGSCT